MWIVGENYCEKINPQSTLRVFYPVDQKANSPGQFISRILSNRRVSLRGGTAPIWKTISLGGLLPIRSCSLPGTRQETGSLPPAAEAADLVPVWPCSGRGLPGRRIAAHAGGLLHHHFTLTLAPSTPCGAIEARAVSFCGPIRHLTAPRGLPGALPCGVRTFLDLKETAISQPAWVIAS